MSQEIIEATPSPRTHWYPDREDITIYGILAALSDPTRHFKAKPHASLQGSA
jgi:hypothetical protein